MRDPARIDRILKEVRELWLKVPDWRLGQLVCNVVSSGPDSRESFSAIFYLEDERFEKLLASLSASMTQMLEGTGQTDEQ